MSYQIIRTDKADEQLRNIIFYIAEDSGSVDVALNYLNQFEKAVMNLAEFPYMGVKPRYSTLRKQGDWILIAERHLVFYKVDEEKNIVTIYAFMDNKREYENLL